VGGVYGRMTNPYKGNSAHGKDLCELMRRINALTTPYLRWGSSGSEDGQFSNPSGLALDASGNVWVADCDNARVQQFDADGTFVSKWGKPYDGLPFDDDEFRYIDGIDIGPDGNVYAINWGQNMVKRMTPAGALVNTIGSGGDIWILGVCAASDNYVYYGCAGYVRKFTQAGALQSSVSLGSSYTCRGLVYGDGGLYCAILGGSPSTFKIVKYDPADWSVLAEFASSGTGNGQFGFAAYYGLSILGGNLFVTDGANDRVQKLTLDGTFVLSYVFNAPSGCTATADYLYVSEQTTCKVARLSMVCAPIEFYAYSPATKASIGDYPDDDALDTVQFVTRNLTQMRDAIEVIVAEGYYLNPATSNPYNWTGASADNLYYVAMGNRTKYGATGGAKYTWTRTDAQMKNTPLYDIDIGEIYECVVTLENADT